MLMWDTWPGFTDRERLVIEFAERFVLDHDRLDAAFFERLRAHLSDPEVLDLGVTVARHLGFGRLTHVLDLE